MKRKSELERLTEAVRQAEAELDAAVRLSDVKAAAKRLQYAKAELRAVEEGQPVCEPARTHAESETAPRSILDPD